MSGLEQAMHGNLLRALARLGALTPRAATARLGPWLLIDASVGIPDFAIAVPTTNIAAPEEALEIAASWFQERGTAFRYLLRDPHDASLAKTVRDAGFAPARREPAMLLASLPPPTLPPPPLQVRLVQGEDDIRRYAAIDSAEWSEITEGIARTASAFPDFALFLGTAHGEDVATSMLVVTPPMAGVYNVHVRAANRRQGFGRAITLAALDYALTQGCTAVTLQSTEMGYPLYAAMGFETRYHYLSLAPATGAQQ
jgi:GNAT superfamily N-acetyltransferase